MAKGEAGINPYKQRAKLEDLKLASPKRAKFRDTSRI
jgi:hypothetical protein